MSSWLSRRHLDDGARRIGPAAPQFLLHLVHQRAQPRHVGHIDHEPDGVVQARALRFAQSAPCCESPPDARLVALDQGVGGGVDAAHAGHEHEIAGARADAPGPVGAIAPAGASVVTPFGAKPDRSCRGALHPLRSPARDSACKSLCRIDVKRIDLRDARFVDPSPASP